MARARRGERAPQATSPKAAEAGAGAYSTEAWEGPEEALILAAAA
jgi:hypothetical protein